MTLKAQIPAAPGEKEAFNAVWDFLRSDTEECLASFWRQATPGTTYWRCHLPALYLPGQVVNFGQGEIEYDEKTDVLTMHDQRGVAIWQFLGDDGRARFAMKQATQGIPTVMELDDNYLVRPAGHKGAGWAKTHAEAMERLSSGQGGGYSIESHKAILNRFDAIITSTEYLADVYSAYNPNVFVCENSVDPTDWNVVREAREVPVFGYYGSASHIRDWPTIRKAFKRSARTRKWVFVGFAPASQKIVPWEADLMKARQNLSLFDIGVCPLNDNRFSRGKSDIKALEYAMAGVMPIVSRTEPYRWWWDDMKWPWVAGSEAEWDDVLQDASKLDSAQVHEVAMNAKALVLEHRTIQENVHKWLEVIDFVT